MPDVTTVVDPLDWTRPWQVALAAYGREPAGYEARLLSLSENATYLCTSRSGDERLILRLHRPGFRTHAQIRSELTWLRALRDSATVTTPAWVPAADGSAVATFPGAQGEQHAALFECVAGREPDEAAWESVLRIVGRETARLHGHARGWELPPGFARPVWDVENLIGRASLWGRWQDTPEVDLVPDGRSLLAEAESRVRTELRAYGSPPDRFGLIHGDLRSTNLLVDGPRVHVIDFDDCGFGWFMYDLACSLSFVEHHPRVPQWVEAWTRGYLEVGRLGEADLRIIPTMIMLRRLLLVAWLEQRRETSYAAELRGTYVHQSVDLARRYLDGALLGSSLAVA